MIEIDLELPLAGVALRVATRLDAAWTALMGPSGAGKTSLLEAVAGLRSRACGRIAVDGDVVLDSARGVRLAPERRRIGYVPQDAALFPHLTVGANVRFGVGANAAAVAHAEAMLEIAHLAARDPVSLSGGERQRVALARALATAPRLLLLDEPLAALDVALRERVLPYLLRLRDEGVRCLYVTHNLGEAVALADDALLLARGRVVAQGRPSTLLATAAAPDAGGLENVRRGTIDAHEDSAGVTHVILDAPAAATRLTVPLVRRQRVGDRVTCVVRAEDILVSTAPLHGLSARNVLAARIADVVRSDADVVVSCAVGTGGQPWLVRLTAGACAALALNAGAAVWLAIKSHSIRLLERTPD